MERTRLEFHVETLREVLPRVGRGGEAALNGGSPTAGQENSDSLRGIAKTIAVDKPSTQNVYTSIMSREAWEGDAQTRFAEQQPENALFALPCACQNLRRLTRIVTRIYDQELRKADIEVTQFGLLTALAAIGEASQKLLSAGLAMDSTTLTRTLGLLRKKGWVRVRRGKDRRERLFALTGAGKRQLAAAQPNWELVEHRLQRELGEAGWKNLLETVKQITEAAMGA